MTEEADGTSDENGESIFSGRKRRSGRILAVVIVMLIALFTLGGFTVRHFWTANQWQKYYDLGVEYLEEENYEEAVVAFTKAIEIDEKKEAAYVGRGGAYIGSAEKAFEEGRFDEAAELYQKAEADYKEATVLGDRDAETSAKEAGVHVSKLRYESVYIKILEMYRQAEESGYERADSEEDSVSGENDEGSVSDSHREKTEVKDDEDGETSINPVLYDLEEKNTDLHYALKDLNGDEIPELFIADHSDREDESGAEEERDENSDIAEGVAAEEAEEAVKMPESFFTDYDVYNIYTVSDGKAVRLLDTDPTDGDAYTIRQGGKIALCHFTVGETQKIELYGLEKEDSALKLEISYTADAEANEKEETSDSVSFSSRIPDEDEKEISRQQWEDLGDTYPVDTDVEWYRIDDLEALGEEAPNEDESWKDAYVDYIETTHREWMQETGKSGFPVEEMYSLVDVNGDEIPELYVDFQVGAAGSALCTWTDDRIIEKEIAYGFSYIEGENIFRDYGGRMDYYYDKIYRVEDGEVILIAEGKYGNLKGTALPYDEEGNPVYQYEWEGTEVSSEEEYLKRFNAVYDTEEETDPLEGAEYDSAQRRYIGDGIYSYDEIIPAVNEY